MPEPPGPEVVLPPPPRRRRVCSGEVETKRPWRWVGKVALREHFGDGLKFVDG
jgi:hypothetical protein